MDYLGTDNSKLVGVEERAWSSFQRFDRGEGVNK